MAIELIRLTDDQDSLGLDRITRPVFQHFTIIIRTRALDLPGSAIRLNLRHATGQIFAEAVHLIAVRPILHEQAVGWFVLDEDCEPLIGDGSGQEVAAVAVAPPDGLAAVVRLWRDRR